MKLNGEILAAIGAVTGWIVPSLNVGIGWLDFRYAKYASGVVSFMCTARVPHSAS